MSLKLRTRATLLIAITFSALLATFLFLTFFVVKRSFEMRTVDEMRSQLQHILEALPATASSADLEREYSLHGRTGESPLAISVWSASRVLGMQGPDSLARQLPVEPIPFAGEDTTYNVGARFIVYAMKHGALIGAAVMSEHTTDEIVEEMIDIFDMVLLAGILLSVIVAAILSRLALDPISRLTAATESLLKRDTGTPARLPVPKGPQEAEALAERFNRLLEERDRSIDTLKHFTADVAHELRSPLTIMRGELEVELRSEDLATSARETLTSTLEEVTHLSGIVDDLLYLARLENVQDDDGETVVSIIDRVEKKVGRLATLITKKKLTIETSVDAALSIRANPAHIDRLLYNLILNAIQYTPQGGRINIFTQGPTLHIQDTGIGIDASSLAHVTERFYRADPSRNRGQGNVGLGLAIAKSICDRYNIQLMIVGSIGQGTTVSLGFPVAS